MSIDPNEHTNLYLGIAVVLTIAMMGIWIGTLL